MPPAALTLNPQSRASQRVWRVATGRTAVDADDLILGIAPGGLQSFAAVRIVFDQLRERELVAGDQLRVLESYLDEAAPRPDDEAAYGRFLGDAVTFAIMRRVSRESVYTARAIDLAARLLNEASVRGGFARVHVADIDRIDRPSVKVFARAALLLRPEDRFCWIWHSQSDPLVAGDGGSRATASRRRLLRHLVAMTAPRLEYGGAVGELEVASASPTEAGARAIAEALVVQNYDACLVWCEDLLRNGRATDPGEILRLFALAATNVGETQLSLRLLAQSEAATSDRARRAHLCYLQGLLEAKRTYDLSESTRHYRRGLSLLPDAGGDGDPALERAWLYNGVALNEAVLWRRTRSRRHRDEAFRLVREAFRLVQDGSSPARAYLRFNLVANSAFLVEMDGNFELAISLLTRTFDFDEPGTASEIALRNGRASLGYRIGMLHYRAGDREGAARLLERAADQDPSPEGWATQERILRALGAVYFDRGDPSRAAETFATGLRICRDARAAEGAFEHGRGLFASLVADGRSGAAQELRSRLYEEEGLELFADAETPMTLEARFLPTPPSPKLPAYLPEIDLEDIPEIDLNRFLGGALPRNGAALDPWRRQ